MCYAEAMIQISPPKKNEVHLRQELLQDQVESTVKSETIFTDISRVSTAF